MLASIKGSGLKDRLMHPADLLHDVRLGVSTFGYHPSTGALDDPRRCLHYTPAPYSTLRRILRRIGLGPDDVFVDLGCGLGRCVFAAKDLGVRRAVGVDIVPWLIEGARRNAARAGREPYDGVQFICTSAEQYSHDETTTLYMFHPFGADTMAAVMRGLQDALAQRPRKLRIAYLNPVHAHVLDAVPFLARLDHWPAPRLPLSHNGRYAVTFWSSRDPGSGAASGEPVSHHAEDAADSALPTEAGSARLRPMRSSMACSSS